MTPPGPADLARVRLAAFDVDGVLTDGSFLLDSRGGDAMRFDTRDGLGLRLLMEEGIVVALISGRRSEALRLRAEALGIRHALRGVTDKAAALRKIAEEEGVELHEVLFLGDDLPDLAAFSLAGVRVTVPEAPPEVRRRAHLTTTRPGGRGAVREVAEWLLAARGRWEAAVARFSGETP